MKAIKVLFDDSPLHDGNALRGVGNYAQFLSDELKKQKQVILSFRKERDLSFKPDLLHYPFFDLFIPTLPLIKKHKTVVTIHDVIPLLYPKFYPVGKRGMLALMRQKLALKQVDAIITDSQASQIDIAKYLKIAPHKIHVVPLAANPHIRNIGKRRAEEIREKHNLPKNYILYVGDINYNKNIPQLIKTLKFLPPEVNLVCLGKNFYPHDIPEWQWIESQIALSDVRDRVVFLTSIEKTAYEELSALYSGAIAYIQPSLYEGFGLPILEAMNCLVPVICTRNSSLTEVALDKAVVVEEALAENFAQAVIAIQSWNQNKRKQFVDNAYTHAQQFSWQKTAQKTIAVYREVMSS